MKNLELDCKIIKENYNFARFALEISRFEIENIQKRMNNRKATWMNDASYSTKKYYKEQLPDVIVLIKTAINHDKIVKILRKMEKRMRKVAKVLEP